MSGGKTALGLDENVGGAISYINICLPIGLIYVLVTEKTNKVVRFHAFQSLLLLGAVIVLSVVIGIFAGIVGAVTGSGMLSGMIGMVSWLVSIGYLIASIIAAVKAYQNSTIRFPVISEMADKWA
jgi:uncharacterized membrane protein